MMLAATYVAPSAIEGLGVFAAEPIAKGAIIWRFDTNFERLLKADFAAELPAHIGEYIDRYSYPMKDDPNTLVLEIDNGRFMNHNEDTPNTDFKSWDYGYATRDIALGEELTCDYRDFYPDFILTAPQAECLSAV